MLSASGRLWFENQLKKLCLTRWFFGLWSWGSWFWGSWPRCQRIGVEWDTRRPGKEKKCDGEGTRRCVIFSGTASYLSSCAGTPWQSPYLWSRGLSESTASFCSPWKYVWDPEPIRGGDDRILTTSWPFPVPSPLTSKDQIPCSDLIKYLFDLTCRLVK